MKHAPTLILCLAGAMAGAGIGWLLRGPGTGKADAASTDKTAGSSGAHEASARQAPGASGPSSRAEEELRSALAERTGTRRWLTLLGAAEKATAADMPGLMRAASGLPGAARMLAGHWARLDPAHMFRTLCTGSDAGISFAGSARTILFEVWTKTDRDAALAALSDSRGFPAVKEQRPNVVNTLMEMDPALALKMISTWGIKHYIPTLTNLGKWAERNPQEAAEAVLAAQLGSTVTAFTKEVGKAWAAKDPAEALRFAAGRGGLAGTSLAQAVVSEWSRRDLKAAVAGLGTLEDKAVRALLAPPLVQEWAKTDPQSALLWANENLTGTARSAAAGEIVKGMAAKDRNGAAAFLATLPPGPERQSAVTRFAEEWLGDEWFNSGNKSEATAALTWLASLPDDTEREQALSKITWRVTSRALDETVAFLNTPDGRTAPQSLFDTTAGQLAQTDPDQAIRWASGLPPEHRASAMQTAVSDWLRVRSAAAREWIRERPAGEERSSFIALATRQLAWQNPAQARDWVRSLPAADRAAAVSGLDAALKATLLDPAP